jgi:DNA polymerase III alpha subunit
MSWYDQFSKQLGRQVQKHEKESGSMAVKCIEDIPKDATPQDAFLLTVEVVRITERETNGGDPYWFVKCEDKEGLRFDVVVWQSGMTRLNLREGATVELDVRVPREPYRAFTLA